MNGQYKASVFGLGEYQKNVVLDGNCGLVCETIDAKTAVRIANQLNALELIAKSYIGAYTANELKQIAMDGMK